MLLTHEQVARIIQWAADEGVSGAWPMDEGWHESEEGCSVLRGGPFYDVYWCEITYADGRTHEAEISIEVMNWLGYYLGQRNYYY